MLWLIVLKAVVVDAIQKLQFQEGLYEEEFRWTMSLLLHEEYCRRSFHHRTCSRTA
jgi:hypothetical protein